tara:strand:- start:1141 stop:1410 length:270 start_codon:yes stop_codon:yes gene_type:complete
VSVRYAIRQSEGFNEKVQREILFKICLARYLLIDVALAEKNDLKRLRNDKREAFIFRLALSYQTDTNHDTNHDNAPHFVVGSKTYPPFL